MAGLVTLQRNRHANLSLLKAMCRIENNAASSRNSLGNVFGLPAGAGVGAALSLVVGVDQDATSGVLNSLLGTTHNHLLGALCWFNLWCLISDLTITGQ